MCIMVNDFMDNKGNIDVIAFLDSAIDIQKIAKSKSFNDVIRKDFTSKGFFKTLDKKIYSNYDDLIKYIKSSTLISKYENIKNGTILMLIESILRAKIENLSYTNSKKQSNEFMEFFDFNNFNEIHYNLVNDLKNVKRDSETGIPLRDNINELIQKWTTILSYKVTFSTIRGRFTRAINFVKKSDIPIDIKDLFLQRFFFSGFISHKINVRTDKNTFDKLSDKIEINKKDFETNFKELSKNIDDMNIKLDTNLNVISVNNIKIKRAVNGKLLEFNVNHGLKMQIFTKLALFITLATGRRLAELVKKPTALNHRIEAAKNDIDGFSNLVDLKYNEIFLKTKNNNNVAIFLNQKKKKRDSKDDIKGFLIPISGGYERIIKALKLLRLFIPNSILKQGEDEISNYMRNYLHSDIWDKFVPFLNSLKDCRGLYAIYNENKYNKGNVDKLIYCQEILGHQKGMKDLKSTLHYQRFIFV